MLETESLYASIVLLFLCHPYITRNNGYFKANHALANTVSTVCFQQRNG